MILGEGAKGRSPSASLLQAFDSRRAEFLESCHPERRGKFACELPAESKDPGNAWISSERVKEFSRCSHLTGENSLGRQE